MRIKSCLVTLFLCLYSLNCLQADSLADQILGNWESEQGNIIVEVFREGRTFKGRIVWFDDRDDPTKPMSVRLDENNPDRRLRNRKVLGLEVLEQLTYNAKSKRWENGLIYDTRTGKKWSSVVHLTPKGLLKVRGFWRFEFIGKSATFRRTN